MKYKRILVNVVLMDRPRFLLRIKIRQCQINLFQIHPTVLRYAGETGI